MAEDITQFMIDSELSGAIVEYCDAAFGQGHWKAFGGYKFVRVVVRDETRCLVVVETSREEGLTRGQVFSSYSEANRKPEKCRDTVFFNAQISSRS